VIAGNGDKEISQERRFLEHKLSERRAQLGSEGKRDLLKWACFYVLQRAKVMRRRYIPELTMALAMSQKATQMADVTRNRWAESREGDRQR
jgi:hypothetical protein